MRFKNILSSNYFKAITRLTFGSLVAQLITVLVSPISTRLYTPEQLGIYTLIITISAMFGPVLSGKYDMAIVSADNEREVNNLIVGSALFSFVFIIFITIGYYFYLNTKPEILEEVGILAYLLVTILIVRSVVNILNHYNNRYKEYKLISSVYVIRTAFQNFGLVVFGILKLGTLGLLLSQLLGSLAGLKKQGMMLFNKHSQLKEVKLYEVKKTLIKYRKQPLYAMPAHFINSTSYSILNFFITGLFGLSSFGYYSMSYRILGLPLSLVSMNVSKVFFQRASEEKQNKGVYTKTLMQITVFLLCLAIP
jgi:O-antigen/teichoic acid export membrane protein